MQASYFLAKIFFLNKVRKMVNLVLLVPILVLLVPKIFGTGRARIPLFLTKLKTLDFEKEYVRCHFAEFCSAGLT